MADIFELFKKISSENTAPSGPITHVVVGLGNPGAEYLHTRHNAGFLAIDYICNKYNARVNKSAHKALVGEATIGGKRVLLVKPQTYMNLSGESIKSYTGSTHRPLYKIILDSNSIQIIRAYNKDNKYDYYRLIEKEGNMINAFLYDLKNGVLKQYDADGDVTKTYGTLYRIAGTKAE